LLGNSIEETAEKLAKKMSRAKYDSIMARSAEATELLYETFSALHQSKPSKPIGK
jgi:hypothetical protein